MSSRLYSLSLLSLLAFPFTQGLAGDAPFAPQDVVALSANEPRSIALSDLDSDGNPDLISASLADGKLAWYPGLGAGEFDVERVIASGSAFVAVLVLDVDGDGDQDVLGGVDGAEKPRWYENTDGAGTFRVGQEITIASDATAVLAAADLDRDGDVDVLGWSAESPGEIRAYLNLGNGTFPDFETIGSPDAEVAFLLPVDLDRDGDLDVLSAGDEISGAGSGLGWWENDEGTWSLRAIGTMTTLAGVGAADLDRDGDLDLVVAGGGSVAWFECVFELGAMDFEPAAHPIEDGGALFSSLAVADLDGDGDPDLVAGSQGAIRWFENMDGAGSFAGATTISTQVLGATALAVADADRDGDMDVLSASADDDKLAIYRNRKMHRSALFLDELVLDFVEASAVAVGDLDRDGAPDLICTDLSSSELFFSPGGNGFLDQFGFAYLDGVRAIDVADFDRNGFPDVVSAAYDEGLLAWTPNYGKLGPSEAITEPLFDSFASVRAGDIDGDGDPDVVSGSAPASAYAEGSGGPPANIRWWENDGTPESSPDWPEHSVGSVGYDAGSVVPVDLDGDGDLDVVAGSADGDSGGELAWFRNDGTFSQQPILEGGEAVRSVAVGDLDGDGDPDVVVAREGSIRWHGNELPFDSWPARVITTSSADGRSLSTADLDNDGDLDVLGTSGDDGTYSWYENEDGAGTFGEGQSFAEIFGYPTGLATSDLDRDGDLDVVGTAFGDGKSSGQLAIYDNSGGQYRLGTENLAPPTSFEGELVPLLAISVAVNSRPGDSVGRLATLALGFEAGAGQAVPFDDVAPLFNADVIVNDGNGDRDPTQDPIDLGLYESDNFAFATQSAMETLCPGDPDGLPDDGLFPANADHPAVQLLYDNADDGFNARRSAAIADPYQFPVPEERYSEVHLFLTTGDGSSDFSVTLIYEDASMEVTSFTVPDWFGEPPPGAYALADGLDRVNRGVEPGVPFSCEDIDNPAIFGFPIPADPAKILSEVLVHRLYGESVANFFGAVGVRADSALFDTAAANALIAELRLYRDDGSGQFELGSDTLVQTFDELDLDSGGLQTLLLDGDDPNLIVALPATFHLVALLTENASAQLPNAFQVTHFAGTSTARNAEAGAALLAEPPLDLAYSFASGVVIVEPSYRVDSGADEDDATPGDATCATLSATCTLRAAVQEANARPGEDLILVPVELGPYTLTEALEVESSGGLTIRGDTPGRPVIDAGGVDRVFDVQDGAALVLENLTLTGGVAPAGSGGAIRVGADATLVVLRSEIRGNSAAEGGGVAGGPSATLEILDSTIAENVATAEGGGIFLFGAELTLRGSTIADNAAPWGGALQSAKSVFTIVNSTVSGNETTLPGSAAISGGEPSSKLVSSTVSANTGGGIAGGGESLRSSLVAGNDIDLSGFFSSLGHNLIGALGSATGFGIAEDLVGVSGAVAPLAANGGETGTHRLLPGSPALDAGSCPDLALDQRGEARRVDLPGVDGDPDGDGCDIGAYEAELTTVLLPLEIPVRWCAVEGAPSEIDPTSVGAGTLDEALRQRIDRATENILEPRAGIVLRSGATELVDTFPVLEDPVTIGQPGDVFIDPETANFDEFLQLVSACRAAWEALDPTVVGITAVQIRQFVDESGAPLPILGLGGRAAQNDAAEQLAAGRVMVVDSFFRLEADPLEALLAHETGHALSLEHGNGKDDDAPPDGIVDNDDDKVAGLPKFDGPNLMQYRNGTELSLEQVERARTHAFLTIPDSAIDLSGVLTDAGTVDPGIIRVLDFGFSKVLDFQLEEIQDFGLSKVLDFGFIKVLDFGLSKVLDFGFSKVLDFGFSKVLDFGMVYGSEGLEGSATLMSATGGVFWPSPIRPDQTFLYFLDVDNDEGTGGAPADHGFPAGGEETGIDLIVQVQVHSTCTADDCSDEQAATAFRFVDATVGFVEDPNALLGNAEIRELTVGLVVDNGGEELPLDDRKMAAIVTTKIKSGVLVEAGARIGAPIRVETLSLVACSGLLPGGVPITCQCESCAQCPEDFGCSGGVGTPATIPDTLLTDVSTGLLTFDPPALPRCTVEPSTAAPGAMVTVAAFHFEAGALLQISLDGGAAEPFAGPTETEVHIPPDTTAAKILFEVEPVGPKAQVARCSVEVRADACGDDADGDGCDDCSSGAFAPALDGEDSDGDGLCDAGDSDDDADTVDDSLDPEPRNPLVCGFSGDTDACDDCSTGAFDPSLDGHDSDGDGLCENGDPDDDNDGIDDLADPALNCADVDGDGLGNGLLDNAWCLHPAIDHDDMNPFVCNDTDENGCDDCSSGAFDPSQSAMDFDQDGVCDSADNCPLTINPSQSNYDFDAEGNACDSCTDRDGDGWGAAILPANTCGQDNCPWISNPSQADQDDDGVGDACEKALIKATPSVPLLWPPNHRMVDLTISIASDVPPEYLSVVLIRAASDESDNGRGDGNTTGDIQDAELGTADLHVRLRAERTSLGQGRSYVLLYEVTDTLSGETVHAAAEIDVPLAIGGVTDPLRLQLLEADGGTIVQWESVPGALHYDVIRGDLASLHSLADRIDLGAVHCIGGSLAATSTAGLPDAEVPAPDQAFFYLVQYHDGADSSYGTESSPGPRIPLSGACE